MTQVVNFFAGPGAGKSTSAAGLFFLMKSRGYRVELVTEYAKDLTYEESHGLMGNQLALLGEQDRRLRRLVGKVDFVITDSPLLLSLAYAGGDFALPWFETAVRGAFDCYDNLNVVVRAVKPYQPFGRRQSAASARSGRTYPGASGGTSLCRNRRGRARPVQHPRRPRHLITPHPSKP